MAGDFDGEQAAETLTALSLNDGACIAQAETVIEAHTGHANDQRPSGRVKMAPGRVITG